MGKNRIRNEREMVDVFETIVRCAKGLENAQIVDVDIDQQRGYFIDAIKGSGYFTFVDGKIIIFYDSGIGDCEYASKVRHLSKHIDTVEEAQAIVNKVLDMLMYKGEYPIVVFEERGNDRLRGEFNIKGNIITLLEDGRSEDVLLHEITHVFEKKHDEAFKIKQEAILRHYYGNIEFESNLEWLKKEVEQRIEKKG